MVGARGVLGHPSESCERTLRQLNRAVSDAVWLTVSRILCKEDGQGPEGKLIPVQVSRLEGAL